MREEAKITTQEIAERLGIYFFFVTLQKLYGLGYG